MKKIHPWVKLARANNDFMRQNGWVLHRVRVVELDESSCRVRRWPLQVLWPWILSSITVDFSQEHHLSTLLLHCPLLSLSLSLSSSIPCCCCLLLQLGDQSSWSYTAQVCKPFHKCKKELSVWWWCKSCWVFFSFGSRIESSIMLLLTASSEFPSQLGGFTVVLLVEVDAVNWRV